MKNLVLFISILFLTCFNLSAQPHIEQDINIPYRNALKGIYWGLDNIPVKKMNLENDLIADNRLYANVKLSKEVNGIKIKSTGYFNSYEVTITIYRTFESLEQEGFIKKKAEEETEIVKEEKKK